MTHILANSIRGRRLVRPHKEVNGFISHKGSSDPTVTSHLGARWSSQWGSGFCLSPSLFFSPSLLFSLSHSSVRDRAKAGYSLYMLNTGTKPYYEEMSVGHDECLISTYSDKNYLRCILFPNWMFNGCLSSINLRQPLNIQLDNRLLLVTLLNM